MKFENIEDRMLYLRSLTDYKLMPNSYVMIMLDGRSFSSTIKKYFKKPFDDTFISIMNETAIYLCEQIQGCKFAYVQSDEISLVVTDFETPETDAFFKYRLEKITSLCASIATSKFNQLMTIEAFNRVDKESFTKSDIINVIETMRLHQFDCKAWNVPSYNDVYTWFLFRQSDCLRNSKQQTARTYLTHKECTGKKVDELINILKETKDIDWDNFDDGKRYGRFIFKETVHMKSDEFGEFKRDKFIVHSGYILGDENGKKKFEISSKIPIK